jgi:hemerythrin-like domain-containing protein
MSDNEEEFMTAPDGMYAREMQFVHTGFRREYGLLPALVREVGHGDTERARLLADHLVLLNSLLHRHHTGEDGHLWPKLLMRVPDELAPLVNAVERQHEGIDRAVRAVATVLPDWRDSADSGQTAALADALDLLVARLDEHLHLEEEQVVPLVEKHITASEWSQFATEGAADTPPDQAPLIFGIFMYEGDPEMIQATISHMPPEAGAIINEMAPKVYAEYAHAIYGTPTPPRVTARR